MNETLQINTIKCKKTTKYRMNETKILIFIRVNKWNLKTFFSRYDKIKTSS